MSFVDKCAVFIKAGDGGNGIVSWRHEAHVPLGGPAGGDGGNGGNIYFIGDVNETSLDFLANKKKLVANNGENGGIKNMHGANADHIYIKVPLGTIVKNSVTNQVIADITVDKKKYLIATGGSGGFGNAHFKSNKNKAPTIYERGDKGEEFLAILELKQISNIGLIGLPNAGKSSLLSILTNA
ncbi:MAG: GTPase ObgE, partial [Methanobrevibacter sp.]|nr:GTPase ObgE [Methanobrevibacter sp.]